VDGRRDIGNKKSSQWREHNRLYIDALRNSLKKGGFGLDWTNYRYQTIEEILDKHQNSYRQTL